MKALRVLVIFMGILIIAGVGLVIHLVSQRISSKEKVFSHITLSVPYKETPSQVSLTDESITLFLPLKGKILIFCRQSGALKQTISLKN